MELTPIKILKEISKFLDGLVIEERRTYSEVDYKSEFLFERMYDDLTLYKYIKQHIGKNKYNVR